MAKKPQGFASEAKPLPPIEGCAIGGHDAGHEHELFVLADDGKWYCKKHFFEGQGRTWKRTRKGSRR